MDKAGKRKWLGNVVGLYRDIREYVNTKLKETRICLSDIPAKSV